MKIKYKRFGLRSKIDIFLLTIITVYFLIIYNFNICAQMPYYLPSLLVVLISLDLLNADNCLQTFGSSYVVFLYLIFSHFGLILLLPFFPELENMRSATTMVFLEYDELPVAVAISSIFTAVYAVTSVAISHCNYSGAKYQKLIGRGLEDMDCTYSEQFKSITYLAIMILSACTLYFLLYGIMHPSIFIESYVGTESEMANTSTYVFATILMALSFVLACTFANRRQFMIACGIFAVAAIYHFLVGNRGEVYYPILAVVAVYIKRKGSFRRSILIGGVVGSLLLLTMIRVLRAGNGVSSGLINFISSLSPLSAMVEAFGEMGFQIGTITYMLRYLNSGGSYQLGATWLFSFQNFLSKYLPFISPINESSPASVVSIMPTNYLAFTNIGEAYYNFSMFGVLVLAVLWAWFLVEVGKVQRNSSREVFMNMCLVLALFLVRNRTASVPVYLVWIVILTFLTMFVSKHRNIKG